MALKLLVRPIANDSVTWEFITTRLVRQTTPDRWHWLVDAFARERGARYAELIPFLLRWIFWRTDWEEDGEYLRERAIAAKILARLYPDDDPNNPRFLDAIGARQQAELILSLPPFPSRRVDEAVHRIYRSLRPEEFSSEAGRVELDVLTEACVRRLYGRGYRDVVVPYLRLRAGEVRDAAELWSRNALNSFEACLPLWIFGGPDA